MCILVTYLSASFVFLDPFAVLSRRRHRLFLKRGLSRIVCGATCKEVMEQRNFLPNVRAEGVMFLNSTLCFYPILYPPNFFNYTLRNSFLPVINKCESSVAKTQTTGGITRGTVESRSSFSHTETTTKILKMDEGDRWNGQNINNRGNRNGNIGILKGNNLLEHSREPSGSIIGPEVTLSWLMIQGHQYAPNEGPVRKEDYLGPKKPCFPSPILQGQLPEQ